MGLRLWSTTGLPEMIKLPPKITDLTGKTFGEMVVLGFAGYSSPEKGRPRPKWLIECSCGKQKEMLATTLNHTKVQSCGHQRGFRTLPDNAAAINLRFYQYKKNAIKMSREFSLTQLQFKTFLLGECTYCGSPPSSVVKARGKHQKGFYYNGVDRVDNEKGYTIDNCVTCCTICNLMKRKMSVISFIDHVKKIAKFNEQKKDCPNAS